jgi:transposase-like protein
MKETAMSFKEVTEVKPYSTKELSHIYGVCDKTLRKWMKPFANEIGEKQGRYFTVAQVEVIFSRLGLPYRIRE